MKEYVRRKFTGERALFQAKDVKLTDCIFYDGESPLKESANLEISGTSFKWKYPLWYSEKIIMKDCVLTETARAGIWYTTGIRITGGVIEAPKTFRRSENILLERVTLFNAQETLWNCRNIKMRSVAARGDYFAMNSENIEIDGFELNGNYSFDGARNVTIKNARIMSKDAFWNSENITVTDSYVSGEYLGWNAKNLTFINCTIESLQGLCYVENLIMKNCKLINTTLAFEYSTVQAEIIGVIDSVLNPAGGKITADGIDELIIEKDKVNPDKTMIVCRSEKGAA